jgi:hypothetical protein
MSKKTLLLVTLFVFVVFRIPAYAAGPGGENSFAHTWNSYSDKEKKSFLFGVATSARAICTDISSMQKDASTQTIEATFRDCFNSYAGMEPDRVIAAMSALYADSKNALIPIDGAYKISLMQVRGDKVDEIIVQARKYGEGIKKELEQQRKKAGK